MRVRAESETDRQIEMGVASVAQLSKEYKVSQEAVATIVGALYRADTASDNATKLIDALQEAVMVTIEEIALNKKG